MDKKSLLIARDVCTEILKENSEIKTQQVYTSKSVNKETLKELEDMSCVELKRFILDRKEINQNGKRR